MFGHLLDHQELIAPHLFSGDQVVAGAAVAVVGVVAGAGVVVVAGADFPCPDSVSFQSILMGTNKWQSPTQKKNGSIGPYRNYKSLFFDK